MRLFFKFCVHCMCLQWVLARVLRSEAARRFVFVLLLLAHRVHVSCIEIANEAPSCNRSGGGSAVGRICARARRPGIWHQLGRRLGGLPTAGLCGCKRPQRLSGRHVGEPQAASARGPQWSLGDQRRQGSQSAAERAGPAAVRETSSPAQASGYCKAIFATPTAINATTSAFGAQSPAAINDTTSAFVAQSPAAIKATSIAFANKAKAIDGTGAPNWSLPEP